MTLLDAPKFDEKKERRRNILLSASAALAFLLFIGAWLISGRPVDWPWHWNAFFFGRSTVNRFLTAVEQNDLPRAYGIWMRDPDWQQHPAQHKAYTFDRFKEDFSSDSPDNEYGAIHSHRIALAAMNGNVLLVAVLINDRKSDAMNLSYDPKTGTLNFAPVALYLGP